MPSLNPSPKPSASAFVTLDRVAAHTPDGQTLFDNLSLAFGRERTGVVGRNGVGKTTLLRLIAGLAEPAKGVVSRTGAVGWLPQHLEPAATETVADTLGVRSAFDRLGRIVAGSASAEDLDQADWSLEERLAKGLAEAGLDGLLLDRLIRTLSGGEQTRLRLAGLMLGDADLLVLDEPTNHLDAEGRGLVASMIARWSGGVVVVSHDRDLLRRMDRIVELSSLGVAVHGGGYDLYAERKAAESAAADRALSDARRALDRVERDAQARVEAKSRRDAAGRRHGQSGSMPRIVAGMMADRAQDSGGRGRALSQRLAADAQATLADAQARVERVHALAVAMPSTGLPQGRRVLSLDRVEWRPGGRAVVGSVSLSVVGPERIAVTGPNGSGKTSLLRLMSGDLVPTAGRVVREVPAVLLDQQLTVLSPHETLIAAYRRLNPDATPNEAHAALARFLFRNTAAERMVGTLSGGERLRAALACVMGAAQPPQLLILDEPSNHLDLGSLAAVEDALAAYDGALIVVSHDEDFLKAIGVERRLELKPSG